MADRIARVWSGSAWENMTAPVFSPSAVAAYQGAAPGSPVTGQMWMNSSTGILYIYSGSAWVDPVEYTAMFGINAQTGTSYTLVLGDRGKMIELNNAAAITLTVPTNASVAFPIGTQISFTQVGAGQVTVAGTPTINATPGLKTRTQWSVGTLYKRATDQWVAFGDLIA